MRAALALLLALLGGPASGNATDCAATAGAIAWPLPDWTSGPAAGPPDAQAAFAAYAFPEQQDPASREGIRTNAVVVIADGRLVFERYARGFAADRPHIVWSVTKSVMHGLYGRAVQEGLLTGLDVRASRWVPALAAEPAKATMTLAQLFAMSSGLAFNEAYEYAPLRSSVIAMLYTRGRGDMAAFAAGHELALPPGTRWSYKSGDTLILAAALRGIVGEHAYPDWPWTALFDPLGMRSAVFERDGAGTFVGSSYLYATARDLARYGLLYAMDGCWAGRRLLPEGWVEAAGRIAPALLAGPTGGFRRAYGAHWWLNRALPGDAGPPMPAVPEDVLIGSGHWGQRLFVLPGRKLVIVRYGDDRGWSFANERFLGLALAAFAPGPGT